MNQNSYCVLAWRSLDDENPMVYNGFKNIESAIKKSTELSKISKLFSIEIHDNNSDNCYYPDGKPIKDEKISLDKLIANLKSKPQITIFPKENKDKKDKSFDR